MPNRKDPHAQYQDRDGATLEERARWRETSGTKMVSSPQRADIISRHERSQA
jgi:hypothetical protein